MKFIHIADLHIGRKMGDISLLEDQRYALSQVVSIAKENDAEAVLIAGDVYNNSSPSAEAMTVFDEFLTALGTEKIKVFLISGNHDSNERISYFSSIVKHAGVYATEKFEGMLQCIRLKDKYGEIMIHMMPFIKPANVRGFFTDKSISTYEQAVSAVIENSEVDKSKRNILICHQFITGAQICESEEFAVGGLDNIDASVFDDFDYVALGHIHRPQKISRETLRYSGSLFKYSFSEVSHKKSVTLIDVGEKGDIKIDTVPLKYLHDVREIKGLLNDIMKMPYSEDYVRVIVNDEIVPPDARVSISTVFPNMIKFSIENSKTNFNMDVNVTENIENKSVEQLFLDFYKMQNNDVEPPSEHFDILRNIMKGLEGKNI